MRFAQRLRKLLLWWKRVLIVISFRFVLDRYYQFVYKIYFKRHRLFCPLWYIIRVACIASDLHITNNYIFELVWTSWNESQAATHDRRQQHEKVDSHWNDSNAKVGRSNSTAIRISSLYRNKKGNNCSFFLISTMIPIIDAFLYISMMLIEQIFSGSGLWMKKIFAVAIHWEKYLVESTKTD